MRTRSLNIAIILFIALIFLFFYLLKNGIVEGMLVSAGILVCFLGISACVVLGAMKRISARRGPTPGAERPDRRR
ncbi:MULTISPECIES: hypothetical protein [Micrococcales]|uniref:hypothetical protein n=1 Tax=Micrococcales TaxID=85006 RepID=UPI000B172483|nr:MULTISPECIES: hypothetical protein [Micrococcales]